MSSRNLVPKSAIGKELDDMFNKFSFRKNPNDSPMARALTAYGYSLHIHPLKKKYTETDWLGSRVSIGALSIIFRQPSPSELLICSIERREKTQNMKSALLGIAEFIYFCHARCQEVKYLGGGITQNSKTPEQDVSEKLSMDRLIDFYYQTLGYIECYENYAGFWIYADMRSSKRFEEFPVWRRFRKMGNVILTLGPN